MNIQYIDRKSGNLAEEKVYGHRALSLIYGDSWASRFFSLFLLPLISKVPLFSKIYGLLQKRPSSRKKIDPFIKTYQIDVSEFQETDFFSFNDFFIRKLKPEKRPIIQEATRAALPADGRYLVYPDLSKVERFYVKGQSFDLTSFLQNRPYARRYLDGAMVIGRLCPTDYHRFHFPVSGTPSKASEISGDLQSVNPIALRKNLSIFWTNKRMVTELDTDKFGKILYVEVGATCVGTIHQTYQENIFVNKGDEKGYFSFGGSCLVLLFEKGRILFDEDLVANSQKGFETKANFGESLGRSV